MPVSLVVAPALLLLSFVGVVLLLLFFGAAILLIYFRFLINTPMVASFEGGVFVVVFLNMHRVLFLLFFMVQMSEEEASQLAKKMINSEFDFNDFLKQSQMMKGMGSLGGVANMIPGMAGKLTPEQINKVEVSPR